MVLKVLSFFAVALLVDLSSGYAKNLQRSYKSCRNSFIAYSPGVDEWKGNISLVNCSVQNQICDVSVSDYYPGPPKELYGVDIVKWYVSKNPTDSYDRIVLNITWIPSHNLYIKYQTGFKVSITKKNLTKTSTLYYCINNALSYEKHVQSIFYYDCYGRFNPTYVKPEDKFEVRISSLPEPKEHPPVMDSTNVLEYSLEVPDCSCPDFHSVRECALKRMLQVDILNTFCANRTVKFYYNVPLEYGNSSKLLLCQGEANRFNRCLSQVHFWQKIETKATVWYRIPDNFFVQNHNYTLYVWGSFQDQIVNKTSFNFEKCDKYVDLSVYVKVFSILIGVFFVVICVLAYWIMRKRWRTNLKSLSSSQNLNSNKEETSFSTNNDSDHMVSVYIVYCDDHPKHKEVVNNFAAHLLTDYGFNVIFELWEPNEMAQNCTQWMQNAMDRADKIIVIWSPGATKRWENYKASSKSNNTASRTVPSSDTFTPVVSQIFCDLFCRRNMGKYYFAFFDYGDQNCVPVAEFQDQVCQTFVLMKEFNKLYFHLKNLEIHGPGLEVRAEPANKACRLQLEKVISHMRNLVRNCEDWYNIPSDITLPHPSPESGIYLAENEASFSNTPSFPIPDIEPLIERPRPIVQPVVPVNPCANPFSQLQALNSIQEWS